MTKNSGTDFTKGASPRQPRRIRLEEGQRGAAPSPAKTPAQGPKTPPPGAAGSSTARK